MVVGVEGELGEEVVDVGQVEDVARPFGDLEGFFGRLVGCGGLFPFCRRQPRLGKEDRRFEFDQVNGPATAETLVEVLLCAGQVARGEGGPAKQLVGLDVRPLIGVAGEGALTHAAETDDSQQGMVGIGR